ncbi:hypothetical protein TCAL_06776 [Tigriopus californicus]|uniref:Costars domain-containing protein n=1 Tax=Tigriopus californicus TaxID=6832 RepID=A0A553PQU3_TIGCA|nr:hypothetical protein TCAL_06776 [Tigriopus californicus]|eukprot:TCALIF_06776-PA protein Name:"Protein of unknown function" AED:0.08 eAED:0.08 QI:114/0.75/0.4/1/0.75/0.8/5/0/297
MSAIQEQKPLTDYWSKVAQEDQNITSKSTSFESTPFSIQDLASQYLSNAGKSKVAKSSLPVTHSNVQGKSGFWSQVTDETRSNAAKSLSAPSRNVAKIDGRIEYFEKTDDEELLKKRLDRHLDKQVALDRISEMSNFWKDATQNADCPKSQSQIPSNNPGWLDKYNRRLNETLLREKKESGKTSVEVLCETIHRVGEQYEDGTASIAYEELLQRSDQPNLTGTLTKAKKFGLVYFDGELFNTKARDGPLDQNYIVLQVPIHEIGEAFAKMRSRHVDSGEDEEIDGEDMKPKKKVTFL